MQIADKNYVGIVIVTRGKETGSNRFYLHEVVLQENLQNESFKTDTQADSHSGDVTKVLQKIISANNSSKVLDENGEPMVMYRVGGKRRLFFVCKIQFCHSHFYCIFAENKTYI